VFGRRVNSSSLSPNAIHRTRIIPYARLGGTGTNPPRSRSLSHFLGFSRANGSTILISTTVRYHLLNFAVALAERFGAVPENSVHPHVLEERSEMFSAIDGVSAELETLNFLNALIYLLKPLNVLETGTGSGLTTVAIASALMLNGAGVVHSIEIDAGERVKAAQRLAKFSQHLVDRVTLHAGDSRAFIGSWSGSPFDFCYFDSLIAFRHEELGLLLARHLITQNCTCVFHDTSRRRGEYFPDFNPEMIAALDGFSQGRQWFESEYSRGLRVIKFG